MTEQLISLETAKLAKEKGFDGVCCQYYDKDDRLDSPSGYDGWPFCNWNEIGDHYSAAPQSLVQKWLREVHCWHVEVTWDTVTYEYRVFHPDYEGETIRKWWFNTYEEALEAGLVEGLSRLTIRD